MNPQFVTVLTPNDRENQATPFFIDELTVPNIIRTFGLEDESELEKIEILSIESNHTYYTNSLEQFSLPKLIQIAEAMLNFRKLYLIVEQIDPGYLYDYGIPEIYEFTEDNINMLFETPWEAVSTITEGDVSWSHDFICFDSDSVYSTNNLEEVYRDYEEEIYVAYIETNFR